MLRFHTECQLPEGMYLVGCCGDDELLVAGDAGGRTRIYLFHVKSGDQQQVYEHESEVRVVGASLDGWRSILAVTTLESRDSTSQSYFKTALAEVPRLSRHLRVLLTIVHLAPLCGLLGTVIGMVGLFQSMEARGVMMDTSTMAADLSAWTQATGRRWTR